MSFDVEISKRAFSALLVMGTVAGLAACGSDSSKDTSVARLTRIATVPLGAEITGVHVNAQGDLFMNVQHPADSNPAPYNRATVGVIAGVNAFELPQDLEAVSVPATDQEKQTVRVATGEYRILGQAYDTFAGAVPFGLGGITDKTGTTLVMASNNPDFNGYVKIDKDSGYLFTNWEDRPGGMSRLKLVNDGDTWSVADTMMLDFSSVNGTWVNCNGSMTPWNTPLTSEELYFDDTADWNNPNYAYHGDQLNLQDYLGGSYPNPYDYGYIVEITSPKGTPTPKKRYALGRISHENAVVMPDEKTVYTASDGTGQAFFKFVADKAGDLSAGTLYAAKLTQDEGKTDSAEAGFDVKWIKLAHADDATVLGWIRGYDGIDESSYTDGSTSYISDAEITDWADGKAADDRAAFLESNKAAIAKGATAEWRKAEGLALNYAGMAAGTAPYVYLAVTEIGKTMSDGAGDIQLDENPCGVLYRLKLNADYNVTRIEPAVAGGPYDDTLAVDQCSTDSVSEPDNVAVLKDGRVVFGEDTGLHENNMLWLYNPAGE